MEYQLIPEKSPYIRHQVHINRKALSVIYSIGSGRPCDLKLPERKSDNRSYLITQSVFYNDAVPVTVVIRIGFYDIICRSGIGLVFVGILSGNFCGENDEDQENRMSL